VNGGGVALKYELIVVASVLFLMFFGVQRPCAASDGADDGVFRSKVGEIDVFTLPERQSEGDASILIGASSQDVKKYVPTGGYATAVNAFAVKTPGGVILIDTGFGQKLDANLRVAGFGPEEISAVLITHSHGDHIGGLLKNGSPAFPNAKVYVSSPEFGWSTQVRRSLSGYEGRVVRFTPGSLAEPGDELVKGIRAIAAFGHTPGHTLFMLESAGERLLVWGDLTHAMAIQMPRPDVSVTYDSDPAMAAAVRKEVLEFAMKSGVPIAGMHIPYPGVGKIKRDPDALGSYEFAPSGM
jgi:glyoxylase-like metal-dependent hydrolase (beta-lactamase superfamily II)